MYDTLKVTRDGDAALHLQLSLPDTRNALTAQMIAELTDFAQNAHNDPARVVILSGAGKVFCAGGDLNWMRTQIAANRETRMIEARKLAMMLRALNEIPKPLIGKIHGGAFGGGVGMAAVCDYVIAQEDTKFGLTETRLGLIPATIGPYVIARLGEGMARRVFMSPKLFDAATAQALGLVAEYGDAAFVDAAVEAQIRAYADAAPDAIAAAKMLTRRLSGAITDADVETSISALADVWDGAEATEGIRAFFAKEKPSWVLH